MEEPAGEPLSDPLGRLCARGCVPVSPVRGIVRRGSANERIRGLKRRFAATVWREGNWYLSQCLEIDIASQGETEDEALANLTEALDIHYETPQATRSPGAR
jgi:predicted RNase H-like HicB family nuclease